MAHGLRQLAAFIEQQSLIPIWGSLQLPVIPAAKVLTPRISVGMVMHVHIHPNKNYILKLQFGKMRGGEKKLRKRWGNESWRTGFV